MLALLGVILVLAAQYAWIRPTNFGGFDEWLILSLNSRGLWSFPHSNRPFQLAWTAPAMLVSRCGFLGSYVLHALYLALSGALLFVIARRVFAASLLLAYVTAALGVAWAPLDSFRLDTVQASSYSAVLAGTLAAFLLFVTAVERGSALLLAMGGVLAWFVVRSYEGVLGLLVGAPLLLAFAGGSARWRTRATLAWEGLLALIAASLLGPLLAKRADTFYQSQVLVVDPSPARYLGRLAHQYWLSLHPLVPEEPRDLWHPSVLLAVAAFLAFGWAVGGSEREVAGLQTRRGLWGRVLIGLVLAGLGYAVIAASARVTNATRMQILSAPGIAIAWAAALGLAAKTAPQYRRTVILGLAAWLVAVGTANTVAMQREWDRRSLYTAQVSSLRQILDQAPALVPGTLVVLIDESGTWPLSFSFRHALLLLYGESVVGHVLGADQIFYALVAGPDGLRSVPWPVLRKPWRTAPTEHAYDQTVVYRLTSAHELIRLEAWEHERLPLLPPAARYVPASRIGSGPPSACARRLLGLP
jgi:hypothetical protein